MDRTIVLLTTGFSIIHERMYSLLFIRYTCMPSKNMDILAYTAVILINSDQE